MSDTIEAADYQAVMKAEKKRSKYGNVKTTVDGKAFDSKAEARRYGELKLLEQQGVIYDLETQPRFPLLGADGLTKTATYVGDFSYLQSEDGTFVVEDIKGGEATKTPTYRLKAKMFAVQYGFPITEVE